MAGLINPRDLDQQVDIERSVPDEAADGAGSGTWEPFDTGIWAQVQDVLPSKGVAVDIGTTMTRPARVRIRYRADLPDTVRFVCGSRVLFVVSGPATLGRREGLEWVVAEYLPGGSGS